MDKDIIRTYLCGLAMGAADIVPGVSGGTIAFIMGIYERLLDAIKSADMAFFKLFFTGHFKQALAKVPWVFLIPLLLGILTSIFSLARLLLYFLEYYPAPLWAFFSGLILASVVMLMREVPNKNVYGIIAMLIGAICALLLTGQPPATASTTPSAPVLFISGFIAICAMILPGISGAFVLVLLGQYPVLLAAVRDFNIPLLLVFALGCIFGLMLASRVLCACLKRFHSQTLLFLIGLMAGSLPGIWPWKNPTTLDPILPSLDMMLAVALATAILGFLLPLVLEKIAKK